MPLGLRLARRPSGGRGEAGLGGLAAARRTRAHTQAPQAPLTGVGACKLERAGAPLRPSRVRALTCALSRARYRVGSLSRALSCALSRELLLVRSLSRSLALALSLSRSSSLACALSLVLSRARECALSRVWGLGPRQHPGVGGRGGRGGVGVGGSYAQEQASVLVCLGAGCVGWVGGRWQLYTCVSVLPDDCQCRATA